MKVLHSTCQTVHLDVNMEYPSGPLPQYPYSDSNPNTIHGSSGATGSSGPVSPSGTVKNIPVKFPHVYPNDKYVMFVSGGTGTEKWRNKKLYFLVSELLVNPGANYHKAGYLDERSTWVVAENGLWTWTHSQGTLYGYEGEHGDLIANYDWIDVTTQAHTVHERVKRI